MSALFADNHMPNSQQNRSNERPHTANTMEIDSAGAHVTNYIPDNNTSNNVTNTPNTPNLHHPNLLNNRNTHPPQYHPKDTPTDHRTRSEHDTTPPSWLNSQKSTTTFENQALLSQMEIN